jgi:hypothetical protein
MAQAWADWVYETAANGTGSTAAAEPPTGTGADIVDGTVHWKYQRDALNSVYTLMQYFWANGWCGHFPWTSNGVDFNGGLYSLNRQGGIQTAWLPNTYYSTNDSATNDSDKLYRVTSAAGYSAGATGPTGTGSAIVDNELTWKFIGQGTTGPEYWTKYGQASILFG